MRLLLDTHVLLWCLMDSSLSQYTRDAIADPANEVAVSAASAWEISIKKALNKLSAPDDLESQIQASGFVALPIQISHAWAAGALPRHHDDPFDRLLIAQAGIEGFTIVTRDNRFADYAVSLMPA